MAEPLPTDVVVRERRSNPHTVYAIGTRATPDQFLAETRSEAVEFAKRYASNVGTRVWFQSHDGTFTLLYTMDY